MIVGRVEVHSVQLLRMLSGIWSSHLIGNLHNDYSRTFAGITAGAKRPKVSNTLALSEAIVLLVTVSVVLVFGVEIWATSQWTPNALGAAAGVVSVRFLVLIRCSSMCS